jgi:hypothetical protein
VTQRNQGGGEDSVQTAGYEERPEASADQAPAAAPFPGKSLWIGKHSADGDILVFDPVESDATASVLSLYSLTQHRTRRFQRAMALQSIQPLTDQIAQARAKKEYTQRSKLRTAHEHALTEEHAGRIDEVRENIISAHRRYIEARGLVYNGVLQTNGERKAGRVTKCHACGIVLDGFVSAACGICSGSLCSCGACSCGKAPSGR